VKASVHVALLVMLLTVASCASTAVELPPDSPEAVAEELLSHLQDGDCEAAVSISTSWMWDRASTVGEARVSCTAMRDARPAITRFRRLQTYEAEHADPLLALSDALVGFEVEFVDGSSAEWGVSLAHEPSGWIAIQLSSDYSWPRRQLATSQPAVDRARCLDVPLDVMLEVTTDPVSGDSMVGMVQGARALESTSVAPDGGPIWVVVIRAGGRDWAVSHDGASLEAPGSWGALDVDTAHATGLPTGTPTANANVEGVVVAARCLDRVLGSVR